jgi:hypothetical protein
MAFGSAVLTSPDSSGKLFAGNYYFFLVKKSDHRSSFFALEKIVIYKKTWNVWLEMASDCHANSQ